MVTIGRITPAVAALAIAAVRDVGTAVVPLVGGASGLDVEVGLLEDLTFRADRLNTFGRFPHKGGVSELRLGRSGLNHPTGCAAS